MFSGLDRKQKEAVGLLSIGTFLEYFDLMLYVHMAVLLNDIFFPKVDPDTKLLLTASTFCTTYILRPFGALIFGYIGDHYGRKVSVVITTGIMAVSCLVMANLPTYDQIGIVAAWIMITCRMIQGLSSMGEVVGALLYLTEYIKVPMRYMAVATIPIFCDLGTLGALLVGTLVTSFGYSWRVAFWIGTIVAVVGFWARLALRETPEFVDAKKRISHIQESASITFDKTYRPLEKVSRKSSVSLFLMECTWPLCCYFAYFYCGELLKTNYGYTAEEVIHQNLVVSMITLIFCIIRAYLCKFFHPLVILKYRLIISSFIFLICPIWLDHATDGFSIGILQALITSFSADCKFASSAIYQHFPIFQRFKTAAFLYALSRALTYVLTSFGLIYLINQLGNIGLLLAMGLTTIATGYGISHFFYLEMKQGLFSLERTKICHLLKKENA